MPDKVAKYPFTIEGDEYYEYKEGTPLFALNDRGEQYYAKLVTGDEVYPQVDDVSKLFIRDKNNNQVYAKDREGNDIYGKVDNKFRYASYSNGTPFYAKSNKSIILFPPYEPESENEPEFNWFKLFGLVGISGLSVLFMWIVWVKIFKQKNAATKSEWAGMRHVNTKTEL